MNSITVTLMTYGADLGEMLGGLAALVTLCLSLRRHRRDRARRSRAAGPGQAAPDGLACCAVARRLLAGRGRVLISCQAAAVRFSYSRSYRTRTR